LGPKKGGLSPTEKDPKQFRRVYAQAKAGSDAITNKWQKAA
jgi:hypothetical protein